MVESSESYGQDQHVKLEGLLDEKEA